MHTTMKVRMSADAKAWLKARSDFNRRTMNAEVLAILDEKIRAEMSAPISKRLKAKEGA